jgi:hypothetical protein
MLITDLVPLLAQKYVEKTGRFVNKTKLIKLVYLAEVYFKRFTGQRLTDQNWIFWKYGPYFYDYENIIRDASVFEKPDIQGDFVQIIVKTEFEPRELAVEEKAAVLRALDHSLEELNDILDYVYFDTEPMVSAENRGDILDFSTIMPSEYYVVRSIQISPQQSREIREKVKQWKARRPHA